jgi:hypothetical protein
VNPAKGAIQDSPKHVERNCWHPGNPVAWFDGTRRALPSTDRK